MTNSSRVLVGQRLLWRAELAQCELGLYFIRESHMHIHLLEEFRLDWHLSGRAHRTVDLYIRDLTKFLDLDAEPNLVTSKAWLASTDSPTVRRNR